MKLLEIFSASAPVRIVLATAVYLAYAFLVGLGLLPAFYLSAWAFQELVAEALFAGAWPAASNAVLFCSSLGVSLYLFYFTALFLTGLCMRLLSRGLAPGRYPARSPQTLRWLVMSGLFTIAHRKILPVVPMTYFSTMFYRLAGARIGRNVWINSCNLFDPWLIRIDDNSIIGGEAVLAAHTFERDELVLGEIHIERDCTIGAHAYLSPGVTVGRGSLVGMHAFVRKNTRLKPGSRIASLGAVSTSQAMKLERGWKKENVLRG